MEEQGQEQRDHEQWVQAREAEEAAADPNDPPSAYAQALKASNRRRAKEMKGYESWGKAEEQSAGNAKLLQLWLN